MNGPVIANQLAEKGLLPPQASTATLMSVSALATNQTLWAANSLRRGGVVLNDGNGNLYLKFGATAATTSYTVKVGAGGYYELPVPIYTGQVDGIWDAANGAVRLTELT